MFKEILKIIPTLENKDLNKMERNLSTRFKRIAKRFGKGLLSAIKGAGVVGLAVSVLSKIINPLQEVQASITRLIKQGDDLVTFANQYGTTAGKLAKLVAYGQSAGLDRESLFYVLSKFQTRVGEATQNPDLNTAVRQYAGRKDTADAFFDFIQNLQKLDPSKQVLVQKEVFGERQILKMADFLQANFSELDRKFFKKFDTTKLTESLTNLEGASNLQDALGAVRNLDDINNKSKVIREEFVRAEDARQRVILERENERIKSYQNISNLSEGMGKVINIIEKGILTLTDMATKLSNLEAYVKKLAPSSVFRGVKDLFGGDK